MTDAAFADDADPFAEPLADERPVASERVLNQDEIDSLLGFDLGDDDGSERSGIRAIINSAWSPTSACRCSRSSSTAWCG